MRRSGTMRTMALVAITALALVCAAPAFALESDEASVVPPAATQDEGPREADGAIATEGGDNDGEALDAQTDAVDDTEGGEALEAETDPIGDEAADNRANEPEGASEIVDEPCTEDDDPEVLDGSDYEAEEPLHQLTQPVTYEIMLEGNGGRTADGVERVAMAGLEDGWCYELPELPFFREGYVFAGWSFTPDWPKDEHLILSDRCTFDASLASEFGGSGTLYALWIPEPGWLEAVGAAAHALASNAIDIARMPVIRVGMRSAVALKATSGGKDTTVTLTSKGKVTGSNGWEVTYRLVSVKGSKETGWCWCINEPLHGETGSGFTTAGIGTPKGGSVEDVKAAMWFGDHGPGASIAKDWWPDKDWDGSAFTTADRVYYTHTICAYAMRGNTTDSKLNPYASFGTAQLKWVKTNITEGKNSVYARMKANEGMVSPQFKVFLIKPKTKNHQEYLGFADNGWGDIQLTKKSGNTTLTNDTSFKSSFALTNAAYRVFKSDGKTKLSLYILTDSKGVGTIRRWTSDSPSTSDPLTMIEAGDYVVKETTASKGYNKDATAHKVTVAKGKTAKVTSKEPPTGGNVKVKKESAQPAVTSGLDTYSLAGAEYTLYSDSSCTKSVGKLATDANGNTGTLMVPPGTYYAKETKASKGFRLDTTKHTVTVADGKTATITSKEPIAGDPGAFLVQKLDAATGKAVPQGNGSLAGAEFTVRYYDGSYSSISSLPSKPERTWVFRTDASGKAYLDPDCFVSGDALYYAPGSTKPMIPLGTIWVKETRAPEGYAIALAAAGGEKLQQITDTTSLSKTTALLTTKEPGVLGGLKVKKVDSAGRPIKGATFSIKNASHNPVVVRGTSYAKGAECMTITSGDDGVATTSASALPFGTYRVTEKSAPSGYTPDGDWEVVGQVTTANVIVNLTDSPCVNESTSIEVPLVATKIFDGTSQGRTLEAGMFSFSLRDEADRELQSAFNDADGKVCFEPLVFGPEDIGNHAYVISEVIPDAGIGGSDTDATWDDEEIVYDTHKENVTVRVFKDGRGALACDVVSDEDGIVFRNETVPAVDMPRTGGRGVYGAACMGTLIALAAGLPLAARIKGHA